MSRSTIRLSGAPEAGFRLESFMQSLALPDPDKRSKLTIVATELFDNVCKHSGLKGEKVVISVRSTRASTALLILFKSERFKAYAEGGMIPKPYYSREERRYRGLGMQMVRNLSKSIHLHAGSSMDGYLVIL